METIVATCYEMTLGFISEVRLILWLNGLRNARVLYQFYLKAVINNSVGSQIGYLG